MLSKLLEALRNYNVIFIPDEVIIDFEQAAFNAISRIWPNAIVKGCFFHFGQAIWRRVNHLGLATLFNTNQQFRRCVELITSLALIPRHDIEIGWAFIRDQISNYSWQVDELLDYVENTWLSDNSSIFHREIWSHYGTIRGRTNNAVEGFHSKINRHINKSQINIYEILQTIKDIQQENACELIRLIGGGRNKSRKRAYVAQDQSIIHLTELYENGGINLIDLMIGLKNAIKLCV